MSRSRWAGLGISCVAGYCGCAGEDAQVDMIATSADTIADSTTGAEKTTEMRRGPVILGAPQAVQPAGWLYALVDAPVASVVVEVRGVPLGAPEASVNADVAGAVYRVPATLPTGTAILRVGWRDEPRAWTSRTIEILEPTFTEVSEALGVARIHGAPEDTGGCAESHTGVAFGDVNGDGRPDLYVGHVTEQGQLFLQEAPQPSAGDLPRFVESTVATGLGGVDAVAMATFVDYDGDGDQDLFIGRLGPNRLFRNRLVPDGEVSFEDVTVETGVGVEDQRTMGAAFGDYDADGDLDLYVVNHAYCFPVAGKEIRPRDQLLRNVEGRFVDRSIDLDLARLDAVGFSAAWVDFDRDGDQDLIVINDHVNGFHGRPNELWRNDGPGDTPQEWSFTPVGESTGVAIPGVNGMGLDLGDVNGDGFVDLAFSNIRDNKLLVNVAGERFLDVSVAAGIERAELPWGRNSVTWGTHLFDADNDGDLDLYFVGGPVVGSDAIPDAFLLNHGDLRFEERTWAVGLADPVRGKASALTDFDRDGRLEFATVGWRAPLRVYRNVAERPENHWLVVELQGRGGNRDALGAIVELRAPARTQTCFHSGRPSLGAGGELGCHFGLGPDTAGLALRVIWPDGSTQLAEISTVDTRVRIVQAQG